MNPGQKRSRTQKKPRKQLNKKQKSGTKGLTDEKTSAKITFVLAGLAHLVERHLAKVEVASSSLVARSIKNRTSNGWPVFYGAGYEARTRYLHLGKVALYQMS